MINAMSVRLRHLAAVAALGLGLAVVPAASGGAEPAESPAIATPAVNVVFAAPDAPALRLLRLW
jgi:hypothetical protein